MCTDEQVKMWDKIDEAVFREREAAEPWVDDEALDRVVEDFRDCGYSEEETRAALQAAHRENVKTVESFRAWVQASEDVV